VVGFSFSGILEIKRRKTNLSKKGLGYGYEINGINLDAFKN
jgi:hypothetical protein